MDTDPLWHRLWPPASLAAAGVVNVAWIALLGYAVARLL
jgi:hypothetical protein